MKISDNFKLMHITASQIIAHYSVNSDLIQKSFKCLSLLLLNSVDKNLKAIALVFVLVGMAKNCKWFLAIFE